MPKQCARDMLLKMDDGTGTKETIGGITSRSFTINKEEVESTNTDSAGMRELSDCGVVSMSLAGSGIFQSDAAAKRVVDKTMSTTANIEEWEIVIPGLGTFTGDFFVSSVELSGEHNTDLGFDISMENAGVIAFVAV